MMEMKKDPVCGMEVNESKAENKFYYKGKMYFFCSPSCKNSFEKEPEKYLKEGPKGMSM
ncbi:copper-transporting P-type ATPase [archaeon]|nr:copper-transporting P-type ATPase [archaeon]